MSATDCTCATDTHGFRVSRGSDGYARKIAAAGRNRPGDRGVTCRSCADAKVTAANAPAAMRALAARRLRNADHTFA
jgi:hypothetical protein